MMRRAPGFAAIAVLTLALGIGANTAIFSVVHALLFKPLPYADSERLVRLTAEVPAPESPGGRATRSGSVTDAELLDVRSRVKGLSRVAFNGGLVFKTMTGRGEAIRLQGLRVSPGMFETLGVPPAIGRVFNVLDQYETPGSGTCSVTPRGSGTLVATGLSSARRLRSSTASRPTARSTSRATRSSA